MKNWTATRDGVRVPDNTNVWMPDATTHQCPRCGSRDTRRSFPRGPIDAVILMFDRLPYRCRKCSKRFIRKAPKSETVEVKEETQAS